METLLLGLAGAVILGALALLFRPLRNRIERRWMKATHDHGLSVVVSSTPEQLAGIAPADMLDVQPEWLLPGLFFLPMKQPPAEGPPSYRSADWWTWAREHGGHEAGWGHVLLRIQATQDRSVALEPPRVVRKRTAPPVGILCGPEGRGGNGLRARQFNFRLDDDPVVAHFFGDTSDGTIPHFAMRKGDTEAFILVAQATSGRYEWHVELPCLVDGEAVILKADDDGKPFVSIGYESLPHYMWVHDERRWMSAR